VYDIGVGRYDVVADIGPSYATKRKEATETQLDLIKSVPLVAQAAPDVVVRNMDIPGADVIADRLKKTLPPNLQDGDDSDPQAQLQKTQAQLNQLAQQHDLLTKALQDATQTIEQKQIERQTQLDLAQLKAETEQAIAKLKIEAGLAQAEVTTKAQSEVERNKLVTDVWNKVQDRLHEFLMQQQQHANTLEQGQQTADNAQLLAAQNNAANQEAANAQ